MPNKQRGSSKKFDQKLQQQFERMSLEEQEDKDQTYEAIRYLEAKGDYEGKKILDSFKEKYLKKRRWALFLEEFVHFA
jgi:hypothetical protein